MLHHLYDVGTCSNFVVFGKLHKENILQKDGSTKVSYVINFSMAIDERIAEGLYYSKAIKLMKRYCENPHLLEEDAKIPDDR